MPERKSFILAFCVLCNLKVPFLFPSASSESENSSIYLGKYNTDHYFGNGPGYKSCPVRAQGIEILLLLFIYCVYLSLWFDISVCLTLHTCYEYQEDYTLGGFPVDLLVHVGI